LAKAGRGFYDYSANADKPAPTAEPSQPNPGKVTRHGELRMGADLAVRLASAGTTINAGAADPRFPQGALHIGNAAWLVPGDGRTATAVAARAGVRDVVTFDLAFDFSKCTRLALARADTCSDAAFSAVVGALQAAGIAVSRIDDVAGLVVLRTVAMLANEAADAVTQGIASAGDIDLALQKASTIPADPSRGPTRWGSPSFTTRSATLPPTMARIVTGCRR
jgi:3-hydroxybutyryl-CoA dehydrogenase